MHEDDPRASPESETLPSRVRSAQCLAYQRMFPAQHHGRAHLANDPAEKRPKARPRGPPYTLSRTRRRGAPAVASTSGSRGFKLLRASHGKARIAPICVLGEQEPHLPQRAVAEIHV